MSLLLQHQFKPLPADKQIDTCSFLDSVSHLPAFFDCLGSAIFSPIKADITGNITKIRSVYESNPTKFKTLQMILEGEKELHGPQWPKVGATLALMWLKRGLKFIQVMLQSIADGERDDQNPNLIKVNITKAYEIALQKYHGWLVQKLFQMRSAHLDTGGSGGSGGGGGSCKSMLAAADASHHQSLARPPPPPPLPALTALFAAPYKDVFLKALSKGQTVKEEECIEKIRQFLVNYTTTIEAIYIMYNKMNAELDYKA
ncbi:hypothetical protein XELAEV_18010403mg [Xenopus laevis]|uniref:Glycolipid transfer protein domain-containing protein n=1 Tax=Xenopus laevis TaxID=8355 RepID=A0A974DUG2_XENLA|nr:hypothetical protein XELAEV_18010403mg [Xenopus laevis]